MTGSTLDDGTEFCGFVAGKLKAADFRPTEAGMVTRAEKHDLISHAGRACILLVDDSHDLRALMCRALARAGHGVVEAGSGDAAASLIGEAGPFDMLVTDVRMPSSYDGVALAAWWREKVPGRPVLFVTGHAGGRLDLGALGPHETVLHKPFQRASLLDAVRLLLG